MNVLATAARCGRSSEPLIRQELARVWGNEQILRYMAMRTQTAVMSGRYELALHGSLMKNFFTRANAHRCELALACEGAEGMLDHEAEGDGFWQYQVLNQFASRIGGGTEEVHRNNLGEQALRLPAGTRRGPGHPMEGSTQSLSVGSSTGYRCAVQPPATTQERPHHAARRKDCGRHRHRAGMGRDITLALATEGADVVLVARSDRHMPGVAADVEALGRRAISVQADVTDTDDCARVAAVVAEEFGSLDILVNSAFHAGRFEPFDEANLEKWARPMEVNYFGTLRMTQALLPALKRAGRSAAMPVWSW